jgi:cytoskeletal protein RodZ
VFEIGASLAAARKRQGLTLAQASELSAIRIDLLQALEEERFDRFPAWAYCRAFIRTYARTLDLDADAFVAAFEEQYPKVDEPVPFATPPPRRLPSVRALASLGALAAVVAGLALLGTVGFSGSPRHGHATTGAAAVAKVVPPPPRRPPPASTSTPRTRSAARPPVAHPLVIRAVTGPCWIEVRAGGANGSLVYQGILEPGQSRRYARRVWVRFGAPWNVVVSRGRHRLANIAKTGGAPTDVVA